jgi:hypothetical protein
MTKSELSRNTSSLNAFYDFEAPEKRKTQPGAKETSAAVCAIDFYVSPDARKRIKNNSDLAWVQI